MGCSLGGLFTMYTLFTHSDMFNRYIAASPAFMWDNKVLYQYEQKYNANATNPPARLFMCVGGVENSVPDYKKLTTFLNNRQYQNLQIESRVLENIGHSGTKGEGYERGLQYAFQSPSLQLSNSTLTPYSGTYTVNNGTTITIQSKDGSLTASFGNEGESIPLFAASETDFYAKSFFFKIHFVKEADGSTKGFELHRYGSDDFATKKK